MSSEEDGANDRGKSKAKGKDKDKQKKNKANGRQDSKLDS